MPLNSHRLNRSPHYAKYARDIGNIPKQMVSIYQHSIADYSNIRQCYSHVHFLIPPLGKRKQTETQKSSIFIPQIIYLAYTTYAFWARSSLINTSKPKVVKQCKPRLLEGGKR